MTASIDEGAVFKDRVDALNHLVIDVQARTRKDPHTGIETVIGPEPPGVPVMVSELDRRGWQYLLHTTYSHLDPEIRPIEVEHHRYRIVLAVSRPIKPVELRPVGHHVASMLGLSDSLNEEALDPLNLYYLPRMHESRLGAFRFASGEGKPVDVDVLLAEAKRSEKAVRGAAETVGMNIRHNNDRKPEAEPADELAAAAYKLATIPPLEYDRAHEEKAKALGARAGAIDQEIDKAGVGAAEQKSANFIEEISPYPEPVIGAELLAEIKRVYRRYCVASEADYTVLAVLALGTYVFDSFSVYPRVLLRSPEKRCGKTVMLEVSEAVVYRGVLASSITAAVIFRGIPVLHPTLLIDEGDTCLRNNEAMRGVVNSSHRRRAAFVYRVENQEIKRFSTWAPIYMAGIGSQADTIEDRSIVIDLRRRLPGERVEKCPVDLFERIRPLRSRCLRWAEDHRDELRGSNEDVAPCGNDRAADNWSPLIAIARLIGEPWESRLMSAFVEKNHQVEDESAGVMLLRDIRQIFLEQGKTRMHSEDLVEALVDLPDRPWGGWKHGKPVTKNSLSRVLKSFGVKSKQLRIGKTNRYGYEAEQFADAWARYTGLSPSNSAARNATALQPMCDADSGGSEDARRDSSVAFLDTRKPSSDAGCSGAAFSPGVSSGGACSRCGGEGCGDCREVEP